MLSSLPQKASSSQPGDKTNAYEPSFFFPSPHSSSPSPCELEIRDSYTLVFKWRPLLYSSNYMMQDTSTLDLCRRGGLDL